MDEVHIIVILWYMYHSGSLPSIIGLQVVCLSVYLP